MGAPSPLAKSLMLLAAIFAAVVLTNYRFNRATKHQIQQLRHGMTEAEVTRILGAPHGTWGEGVWYYWTWSHMEPIELSFDDNRRLK